jgi:hypothetical protein
MMEHALYHKLLLVQVIVDALNGIGMIKFVFNAVLIGILPMENAIEFLIIVKLITTKMDYANHATKDII